MEEFTRLVGNPQVVLGLAASLCFWPISVFTGVLEGEGDVVVFSVKFFDRRNSLALIESATLCHDCQVMGLYLGLNPVRLTVLAPKSEDYTTVPK